MLALEKAENERVVHIVSTALVTVAARLEPAAEQRVLKQAAEALLAVLAKSTDRNALQGASTALGTVAARLEPAALPALAEQLLPLLQPIDNRPMQPMTLVLLTIAARLPATAATQLRHATLAQLFECVAQDVTPDGSAAAVAELLPHLDDLPFLARFLDHPGCVGQARYALLRRLEALAFPAAAATQPAQAGPALASALVQPLALGPLCVGHATVPHATRRWHSPGDAITWLQHHRPEINLDTPYVPGQR
jgi:hypothetical protein